ncbi:MAG: Two-component hybrid sensor and regulator [Candidatus Levybacteria bacterium GW2011_GWA2_37_36]|nr:MAG: Two-component hybrid sensor and regulator [Candidatus Levybacteria bacterium GW2011_GWA1_37_16]KKQ33872.1 MAG: Two-component hybrid sensor and regulator [Candidatus Levybacteria bacterium GW2011_GWA2_37_36]KKQ38640.1 MAG: Two-component hybrid sensor and regulator [Candidatus Levybacteria bacterium GW2011_GWC2_37_7]KKQ42407.1 MAG: Two-component hybrid sensor and regulator [Candidatus Levybacteria bacterium GW2011_GWB1_37_8]
MSWRTDLDRQFPLLNGMSSYCPINQLELSMISRKNILTKFVKRAKSLTKLLTLFYKKTDKENSLANILKLIYNKEVMDKKKILIVDDEEAVRKVIAEALGNQEFTLLTANNGEEGLSLSLKEHPDLILLDILMPKVDGMIMLQKLRKDEWGKKVPVIILTNVNPNSSYVINSVLQNEPAYYLVKADVKLEGIVDKVKEVLKISD